MALPPGHRIGVYHIPGLVGVGGWGEVYRAHDDLGTGAPANP